jgi:putative endonuclease
VGEEYFVYVLYSKKLGRTYTGHSNNVRFRLIQHNSGFEISTKYGVPWDLIYTETFKTRGAAIKREKELKTGKGRDYIKKIMSR